MSKCSAFVDHTRSRRHITCWEYLRRIIGLILTPNSFDRSRPIEPIRNVKDSPIAFHKCRTTNESHRPRSAFEILAWRNASTSLATAYWTSLQSPHAPAQSSQPCDKVSLHLVMRMLRLFVFLDGAAIRLPKFGTTGDLGVRIPARPILTDGHDV